MTTRRKIAITLWLLMFVATAGLIIYPRAQARRPIMKVYLTGAFSPNGDGVKDKAVMSFKAVSAGDFAVTITDSSGRVVFSRASTGREGRFEWDGEVDGDVKEGSFSMFATFKQGWRTRRFEREIVVDNKAPVCELLIVKVNRPRKREQRLEVVCSEAGRGSVWIMKNMLVEMNKRNPHIAYKLACWPLYPKVRIGPQAMTKGFNYIGRAPYEYRLGSNNHERDPYVAVVEFHDLAGNAYKGDYQEWHEWQKLRGDAKR